MYVAAEPTSDVAAKPAAYEAAIALLKPQPTALTKYLSKGYIFMRKQ